MSALTYTYWSKGCKLFAKEFGQLLLWLQKKYVCKLHSPSLRIFVAGRGGWARSKIKSILFILLNFMNSTKKNKNGQFCDVMINDSSKQLNILNTNVVLPSTIRLIQLIIYLYINKVVNSFCLFVCMSDHNSATTCPIYLKLWPENPGKKRECS